MVLKFPQSGLAFGESHALIVLRSALVMGNWGDGKNDLQRHYPFDLLVFRGKAVGFRRGRDWEASFRLQRLPPGSERRDYHTWPLFQPGAHSGGTSRVSRGL